MHFTTPESTFVIMLLQKNYFVSENPMPTKFRRDIVGGKCEKIRYVKKLHLKKTRLII